jgi:RNA polymerase sigma-B factor
MSDVQLARLNRAGDPRARETLIARHLPLARGLALRYRRGSDPTDDLVQVASCGLIKAVDRWDPDRGSPFCAFAAPTILGELRRYFRDATWFVRPPRALQELVMSVERERASAGATSGRAPSCSDIAARLGRSGQDVADALQAVRGRSPASLDGCVSTPEEDIAFAATIGRVERGYAEAEARATIERLIPVLDERARFVLRLRFDDDLTQAEIAARIGVSQMQVSRIIRQSLAQMAFRAAQRQVAA